MLTIRIRKYFFLEMMTGGIVLLSCLWFLIPNGLQARYYDNQKSRETPILEQREQTISLQRVKQQKALFPQTNFSVTWHGWIRIDFPGTYIFSTDSDDSSALFIDDRLIVDNAGLQKRTGAITLSEGMHRIRCHYQQGKGNYSLQVSWISPQDTIERTIPKNLLYAQIYSSFLPLPLITFALKHFLAAYLACWLLLLLHILQLIGHQKRANLCSFANQIIRPFGITLMAILLAAFLSVLWIWPQRGLNGRYFDTPDWTGEPFLSSCDRRIDLEKISQQQDDFPQHDFSIAWHGFIRIDQEGQYAFSTLSDDGSSVFIDGKMIVDNGGFHASRRRSGMVALSKGLHAIRINYFQGAGDYELKVFWRPPNKPESNLPPLLLYRRPFPIRGLGMITRNLFVLYPLSWLFLGALMLRQRLVRHREDLHALLRQSAKNVAFSTMLFLIFVLLAEGGFRLVLYIRENRKDLQALLKESEAAEFTGGNHVLSLKGMIQASPYEGMVYELKPLLRGMFAGAPLNINARGWRDYEYPYKKNEGVFRIAMLGDSCLFGWGIKMEETTPKVLERQLNRQFSPRKYEVLNLGVPGYNTAMEVELFYRKSLAYSPDMVILHFFDNDYDLPLFMKKPMNYSSLRKFYLFDFIYARYQTLQGRQNEDAIDDPNYDENPAVLEQFQEMSGVRGFTKAMMRLVELAKARHIPLIVYSAKAYPGLHASYRPYSSATEQLALITRLSKEYDFSFVNSYPYYVKYMERHPGINFPMDFKIPEDIVHFNAIAHSLDAEALYDFLATPNIARLQ